MEQTFPPKRSPGRGRLFAYHKRSELASNLIQLQGASLPLGDSSVDVIVCDSVLDSMEFEIARAIMREFTRVSRGYLFLTLISAVQRDGKREAKDEIVKIQREMNTFQSYYDERRVLELLDGTEFEVMSFELIENRNLIKNTVEGRYFISAKLSPG